MKNRMLNPNYSIIPSLANEINPNKKFKNKNIQKMEENNVIPLYVK